jgi:hypothetical protein
MAETKTQWLKVARVDMKGKILDISDPDPMPTMFDPDAEDQRTPKLALNYVRYNTNDFHAECQHRHFVDLDVLDLLCWDILTIRKGDKTERGYTPILDEFKGGPAKFAGIPAALTALGDDGIISRRLTVSYMDQLNGEPLRSGPVYQFSFEVKEGVKGDKGQITPVKGGETFLKESINVPIAAARKAAKTMQRYLTGKQSAAHAGYAPQSVSNDHRV